MCKCAGGGIKTKGQHIFLESLLICVFPPVNFSPTALTFSLCFCHLVPAGFSCFLILRLPPVLYSLLPCVLPPQPPSHPPPPPSSAIPVFILFL